MSFDQVGGLDHYVRALKEMVFLPLGVPRALPALPHHPAARRALLRAPGCALTHSIHSLLLYYLAVQEACYTPLAGTPAVYLHFKATCFAVQYQ